VLQAYERRLTQRAEALVTVNEGYLEILERRLRPKRSIIVRNCPPRWQPTRGRASPLRALPLLTEATPLMLYHGIFGAGRGVEQMAQALLCEGLESTHAVALGFGDRTQLDEWAAQSRFGGRLHVVEAVPPHELIEWVSGADVDVVALQQTTLNHYLCTPNKLWESIAAGVPVIVSDFPVMRKIVMEDPDGPLGAVCDPADVASIADAARSILTMSPEERADLRSRCRKAATERWNWETESSRLVELYRDFT